MDKTSEKELIRIDKFLDGDRKVCNGESYDIETADEVIIALQKVLNTGERIRIWYSNEDGTAIITNTMNCQIGYLKTDKIRSRSRLYYTNSSSASAIGMCVGTKNIGKIATTKTKETLYEREDFRFKEMKTVETEKNGLWNGNTYVQEYDSFLKHWETIYCARTKKEAENFISFAEGKRNIR